MAPLTHADLEAAKALWQEWVGEGYTLDVQVIGDHAARMDPDRPLGAIVTAKLSLRLIITTNGQRIFNEACPYDGAALRASVRALARAIAER